ncbi:hypothetical protein F5884DRAFT_219119 [Xylogone sp. PMI_703]|nr:hypothetical protein F5884DRAFT_219119 [Xylogone sp. PMI_703]
MRAAIASSLLALSATALAQYTFDNASDPFTLVVSSTNAAYDNHFLTACHEGAAIEALCLGGVSGSDNVTAPTFTFNSSTYNLANPPANGGGAQGLLIYILQPGGINEPEALTLSYNPVSNIAVPLFEPGADYATYFSFDAEDKLNLQGAVDNGSIPQESAPYYNWQICQTYVGYAYTTLAWLVGSGTSNNPTCEAVTVKRVFA